MQNFENSKKSENKINKLHHVRDLNPLIRKLNPLIRNVNLLLTIFLAFHFF